MLFRSEGSGGEGVSRRPAHTQGAEPGPRGAPSGPLGPPGERPGAADPPRLACCAHIAGSWSGLAGSTAGEVPPSAARHPATGGDGPLPRALAHPRALPCAPRPGLTSPSAPQRGGGTGGGGGWPNLNRGTGGRERVGREARGRAPAPRGESQGGRRARGSAVGASGARGGINASQICVNYSRFLLSRGGGVCVRRSEGTRLNSSH